MPVEMLGAVMGIFLHWGFHQLAFRLFLEFVGYMRPGECSNLEVSQLIPPQPSMTSARHFWAILLHPQELKVPGKTAVLDVSILIDSDLWMGQFGAIGAWGAGKSLMPMDVKAWPVPFVG